MIFCHSLAAYPEPTFPFHPVTPTTQHPKRTSRDLDYYPFFPHIRVTSFALIPKCRLLFGGCIQHRLE